MQLDALKDVKINHFELLTKENTPAKNLFLYEKLVLNISHVPSINDISKFDNSDIVIAVVNRSAVNAAFFFDDDIGKYVIGIYDGLISSTFQLLSSFFNMYGVVKISNGLMILEKEKIEHDDNIGDMLFFDLHKLALNFFSYHEFGHYKLNHLQLLKSIVELKDGQYQIIDKEIKIGMELEADKYSIGILEHLIIATIEKYVKNFQLNSLQSKCFTEFLFHFTCMGIIPFVLSTYNMECYYKKNETHPTVNCRTVNLVGNAMRSIVYSINPLQGSDGIDIADFIIHFIQSKCNIDFRPNKEIMRCYRTNIYVVQYFLDKVNQHRIRLTNAST